MKIYYAHHLYKYDTKVEDYEIELIKKELPQYEILNPNGDIQHENIYDEEKIMKRCLNAINNSAAVVFSSLNGVVGKGVYDEVNQAIELKKSVYYIQNNKLNLCKTIDFEIINESRRIYAIVKLV